jgi:two-component system OmpR family sensor kinase
VRRLPIRVKLTIAFVAVMALVLGATGLFVYLRFEQALDDTLNQGLRTRASDVQALVKQSDSGLATKSRDPLADRGERVAQILDSKGHVVDAAPGLSRTPVLTSDQIRRALRSPLLIDRANPTGVEGPLRLYASPVDAQDQRLVVVVGSTLGDRDDSLSELGTLLLLGGPVALLLASLVGFIVTGAALRPVEAMRRRASAISAGEPGQRLPVPPTTDEIGRLGETLNAMLARLEAAFERERTFVSDASHELRTPLAILKTELELALRGGRSAEELEAALRSAADETDRLAQLAEDLLVIARSDQGRLPIRTTTMEARSLLEAVRDRYARRAAEAGTPIDVIAPHPLPLVVDELRLEQAIGNLVDNALRYGKGPIELTARRVDGQVELSVRDHGEGLPEGFVAKAFERFTRVDSARSRGGAGLGLAIVQAIAGAHGGTASAANAEDGGARVTVVIPDSAPSHDGDGIAN